MAQSEGFRVETDVFVGDEPAPVFQSLTLFENGIAYDYSRDDDATCTIVDPQHDRIVLVNSQHQIRTELSINEIAQLIETARTQAAGTSLAVFLIGAGKIEVVDGIVTVGDDNLRYVAKTSKPNEPYAVQWYRTFADAMANFNAWASGGTPPFARLALNGAVADLGSIPVEIRRDIKAGKTQVQHTSRLRTTWLLSKTDRARIAQAQKGLVTYTPVDLATFHNRVQAKQVANK
ncbi:MAG: hypothetical protein D6753_09415 [Planctomycetota bacterium]|nr:MAG: hypothetical protein D6753_09415 [Planctomycetota bacterium]